MRAALALARRGLGRVWPNPAVGCVIVGDGSVVGRGWTQPSGRPHAETEALRRAGKEARGATAYISLEPCAHHGNTPPCAEALAAAGITRAVIAVTDPDPRVSGRGTASLAAAGIETTVGLCAEEASELNAGFFSRVRRGRPLVTLKIASSLDGQIATRAGQSQWITGPAARAWVHALRAISDAVLVGTGTAVADNPALTCRLPGMAERSPVRVLLDRQLRVPLSHRLVAEAAQSRTWVITSEGIDPARRAALVDRGAELIDVPIESPGRLSLAAAMTALGARGITRLLVEPGATLAAALLQADLVDELIWFNAPIIIGGDGRPGIAGLGLAELANAQRFRTIESRRLGEDIMTTYRRSAGG